jgi:hypothetical protein
VGYLDQNVHMTATHSLVDEMLDQDDPVSNAIRAYEHAVARHEDERAMQPPWTAWGAARLGPRSPREKPAASVSDCAIWNNR